MQLQQLRYFLAVAKNGSISGAAKELFVAQPTLSQQIIHLEKELGIALLVRHSKSVSLTDAGEQFAQHVRHIVGELDQLQDLMQQNGLLKAGTLRLGFLWIAGYLNLYGMLEAFRQRYPALTYKLKIDGSRSLLGLLNERRLHAAFVLGEGDELSENRELYSRKIIEDFYTLMIPAAHPLSARKLIRVSDLADVPLIMPAAASTFRARLDHIFEKHHLKPQILCETSQSETVAQLTGQGLGIGFSSYSIAKKLKSDAQVLIPFEYELHRSVYYVTLTELLDYPSVRSLTKFVEGYSF